MTDKKQIPFIRVDSRALPGIFLILILAGVAFFVLPAAIVTVLTVFFLFIHMAFFRDPMRVPAGEGVLSPADGKVVEVSVCDEPKFLGCKAVKIGVFLSVLNVHVNRLPSAGKLEWQEYVPGKFLNALDPDSAIKNESNWMGFRDGNRKFLIRQISGLIARHIHWDVKQGETLPKGAKIGMICYGSRAEIYLPESDFEAKVHLGDIVKSAETVLGVWKR